jgi:hypothetical protein
MNEREARSSLVKVRQYINSGAFLAKNNQNLNNSGETTLY